MRGARRDGGELIMSSYVEKNEMYNYYTGMEGRKRKIYDIDSSSLLVVLFQQTHFTTKGMLW
jgi:predicted transcriptional regulator